MHKHILPEALYGWWFRDNLWPGFVAFMVFGAAWFMSLGLESRWALLFTGMVAAGVCGVALIAVLPLARAAVFEFVREAMAIVRQRVSRFG